MPRYALGDSETLFDSFNGGRESWADEAWKDNVMEERLRYFVEECDRFGGFQVMTTVADGFGGLASGLLESLRDDYPKAGILTFGLEQSYLSTNSDAEVRFGFFKHVVGYFVPDAQ